MFWVKIFRKKPFNGLKVISASLCFECLHDNPERNEGYIYMSLLLCLWLIQTWSFLKLMVIWDHVQLRCKEMWHRPKSMAVVPLCARPDYGLCLFSHTILISFGYSQRLCFLTSYILRLATCDRCTLVPICLMQNCKKMYPCFSHRYAKMSRVTSQHKDPQKYKRKVLGIIPCKCRPVWEAVCRNISVRQAEYRVWVNTVQHHRTFLPCNGACGTNTSWPQNWMVLKVSLSFAVDFFNPPSKDTELKLGKL